MIVAVFEHMGTRKVRFIAYTTWYNPEWEGCCLHGVKSGPHAKAAAIEQHRSVCRRGLSEGTLLSAKAKT